MKRFRIEALGQEVNSTSWCGACDNKSTEGPGTVSYIVAFRSAKERREVLRGEADTKWCHPAAGRVGEAGEGKPLVPRAGPTQGAGVE